MCMTCGCGIGQTLIAGHAIQRPRKPGGEMHYRVREEGAAHAHPHGHTHDPIDFGTGPAGTHAPGMSQARMVKIERDILAKNNGYADQNRRYLSAHSIFALNLVSSPGSGKTTLLVRTIAALNGAHPHLGNQRRGNAAMAGVDQGRLPQCSCRENPLSRRRERVRVVEKSDTVIALPFSGPPVLACGAWLKNTVCVTRGSEAHVSQRIGDLDSAEARTMLDATVARLCNSLEVQPEIVAHDLHPDFYSTRFAQAYAAQRGLPLVAVQHHHAHIAAVCAEHHVTGAVLGLALDGVGLGSDGTPWGGELLYAEGAEFERLGHLAPLRLPGGDRAAREPWRMAAAVLFQLGRGDEIARRFSDQPGAQTVAAMLQRNLNCPITSSTGRLFDAAAGLLGVNEIQAFEAQAAVRLQELAQRHGQVAPLEGGYRIAESGVLDFSPLLAALADCRDAGHGAALFHATLAAGLAEWVEHAAHRHSIADVALGGGCFHNDILLRSLSGRLAAQGLRVLTWQRMQPNDSAISLGQAWVAARKSREGLV